MKERKKKNLIFFLYSYDLSIKCTIDLTPENSFCSMSYIVNIYIKEEEFDFNLNHIQLLSIIFMKLYIPPIKFEQ